MLAIGWQPIFAAGPLERSLSREASRLARDAGDAPDRSAWRALWTIDVGTAIIVTTTANTLVTGTLDSLDAAAVSVKRNGAVERIALDDVLMVEKRVRRGSALTASLAAIGGLYLGSMLAVGIGFSVRCQPGCGGTEALMASAVVGLPIAAGYGGWRASSHMVDEVVYRRPPTARP